MNEHIIKFTNTDDVQQFVRAAGECDFDIDLIDQHRYIDAKSILGVLSIGLAKELKVKCSGGSCKFEQTLQKYAIA
ncbi:MAG: HPr family phosphocarrier protein [Lachnospiraceae bacterium]